MGLWCHLEASAGPRLNVKSTPSGQGYPRLLSLLLPHHPAEALQIFSK